MDTLYHLLGGQARRLLDHFMDKWSWTKDDNPYILEAIAREEDRAVWRNYYMEKSVFNLKRVYMVNTTGMPTRPDLLPDPIQEPGDLEEFLAIIRSAFQMASAAFFEDLHAFRAHPRESIGQVGRWFR